ncbi:MAG: glycosyltransferase family 4 protein [Bacteroidetes bacterium]|nr:glycosyltransferase family 4 protein [Bacteroidota bacterium]
MKVALVANTSWFLYNFFSNLIQDLNQRNVQVVTIAPYDEWSSHLSNIGTRYIDVPMSRKGLNPFVDFKLVVRLYRIYSQEKPDVIFHNTIKPVIYGSIAASHAKIITNVNMISGLGYVFTGDGIVHKFLRPIVHVLYRCTLKKSSKVLFLNNDDKDYFINNGLVEERKVEITYGSGIDTQRFSYSESQGDENSCIFLFIGRILGDKGVNEYVKAAMRVRKNNPSARFQLVGRFDEGNPTCIKKELIEKCVSDGFIEYLGVVDDIRPIIEKADAIVLPSYREGIPRSLLEGMSMGKPVIATDVPGCRDTVLHNENGLLVPARDIEALVQAMEFMILHPERRIEMGKIGRKLAVEKFDIKRVNAIIFKSMNLI